MNALAVINGQDIVTAVVWVVVAATVFFILNWFLEYCGVPEPFHKVAKVIIALVTVVVLINALLGLAGHEFIHW